jgi:hypothetical protein
MSIGGLQVRQARSWWGHDDIDESVGETAVLDKSHFVAILPAIYNESVIDLS